MQEVIWTLQNLSPNDVMDIFIVAGLIFGASFLFRGTQALTLFRGMFTLIVVLIVLTGVLRLQALGWLLNNGLTVLAVAIPIIFQPELRRALERLGRSSGGLFSQATPEEVQLYIIDQVCKAAKKLSERRHGALIVLQRGSSLQEYVNTGVVIDSQVTVDLLLTVFWPKTELHDGAVIIDSKGRMAAAASVLPLSASRNLPDQKMGTRHRASLGISEISDALCVVVSEESGKIAITNGGRMVSRLEPERLRTILNAMYGPEHRERESMRTRIQHRVTQFFSRSSQPTKAQQSKI